MNHLLTIILLCGLMLGCRRSSPLPSSDKQTLERHTILDEALGRTDLHEEWSLADRDLPADIWTNYPKIGRVNKSRFQREVGVTHKLLEGIKPRIQNMTASNLLDSLHVLPAGSGGAYASPIPAVVYYVWRDGNEMIMDELKRRPPSDLETLRSHTNDFRVVFTDDSGEFLTVGDVVHRALGDKSW